VTGRVDGPEGRPAEPVPEESGAAPRKPPRRRATTAPPAGSDPHPAPEPERHAETDNDARLRAEKPPHY